MFIYLSFYIVVSALLSRVLLDTLFTDAGAFVFAVMDVVVVVVAVATTVAVVVFLSLLRLA